jgi:hypothetical protein
MPSFIKATLTICFLSVFYISYAIAMDDEDKNELHVTHKIEPQKAHSNTLKEEEKQSCSHWGLTRWLYGIKEYAIDRCLLSGKDFNYRDPERAYVLRREISNQEYEILDSSDCYICVCSDGSPALYGIGGSVQALCCCPCVTMIHMLCLPFQCYYCDRDQTFMYKQSVAADVRNMTPEERENYHRMRSQDNEMKQANVRNYYIANPPMGSAYYNQPQWNK